MMLIVGGRGKGVVNIVVDVCRWKLVEEGDGEIVICWHDDSGRISTDWTVYSGFIIARYSLDGWFLVMNLLVI